ncbi:MAG TPA: hypothetical protein VGC79_12750, partial [Polyangiaceae bacterium]
MPTDPSFAVLSDPSASARPVCVALDGTLVATQLFSERVALLFRQRPWVALALPFWMLSGPSGLKRRVAQSSKLDAAFLPYRRPLIASLQACRDSGRQVVLAGPADVELAKRVASHLGLFDAVYVSDPAAGASTTSESLAAAYPQGFDYIGHSVADRPALSGATRGFLVGAAPGAASALGDLKQVQVLSRRPSILRALVKELRPHQWAKNALVVIPAMLADAHSAATIGYGVLAAGTFSLCASAGYVFNDLLDLDADRIHPSKA